MVMIKLIRPINLPRLATRTFSSTIPKMSNFSGKLNGKVAIVTASTDGIGLSIVKKLVKDGAKVMLSSRKEKNVISALAALEKEGLTKERVQGIVCHVGKKEDRLNLLQKTEEGFGGIDILISNAATNPVFGSVMDCPEDAWDKIFEINVKAAMMLTQEVYPFLIKRSGGSIVYISSIAGFQGLPALGAYSISKTALLGMTKVVSQELAADNIRVNCVCPGIVNTKFASALVKNPEILEKALETIPLRRIAEPDEMGGMVSFLCSDDASYITGENFLVAGGMNARL